MRIRLRIASAAFVLWIPFSSFAGADELIFQSGFEPGNVCAWSSSAPVAMCDPLPTATVAWFNQPTCPSGWEPYSPAVGRTLIPSSIDDAGATAGIALASGEDLLHNHSVETTLDIASVSFSGAAGGGNTGVGAGGLQVVQGTAAPVSLGVPYVQLLACRKFAAPLASPIPASALMLFDALACPTGFVAPSAALGRLVVGLPPGGVPGAQFGGSNLATASHGHSIAAEFSLGPHGIGLLSGCCAGGYAAAGSAQFAGDTVDTPTVFPYLEMLACASGAPNPGPDLLPPGLVMFVEGASCPTGWIPSTATSGRIVVGAGSGATVGVVVGSPYADQEVRMHDHSFDIALVLPPLNIAAADGGNLSGAQSGNSPASGTSGLSPTGLPFVQLQACERAAIP